MSNTFSVYNEATITGGLLSGINFLYGSTTVQGTVTLPSDGYTENIGTLLVAQNAVLNVDGELVNGNNCSIFVDDFGKFNLAATGILQGRHCKEFWSGVTVQKGAWFKALPGSHINHMRDGVQVGAGTPLPKILVNGAFMDENYVCFQFDHAVRGYITGCSTQYRGNLELQGDYLPREIAELDEFYNGYSGNSDVPLNQSDQKGYAFINVRAPMDLIGNDEDQIFTIQGNIVTRYLTGISTILPQGETGMIRVKVEGNDFRSCNRSINLLAKGYYLIINNIMGSRINYGENVLSQEHYYANIISPSSLNNIGYIAPIASIQNAMVHPKYVGITVMGSGSELNIFGNTIAGNEYNQIGARVIDNGIFADAANCTFQIKQNTFVGLRTGIQFYQYTNTIERMECNSFANGIDPIVSNLTPQIGFLLGARYDRNSNLPPDDYPLPLQPEWGTAALTGAIGYDGYNSLGHPNPSGNAWPVDEAILAQYPVTEGISVLQHWISPVNWVSLQNNNPSFNLEYWAYNNEFVWPLSNNTLTTKIKTRPDNGELIMLFRSGIPNPPVDDPGVVVYREKCDSDLPDLFPFLRQATTLSENAVTSTDFRKFGFGLNPVLGDAIPNPASSKVSIPVFIPQKSGEEYVLSVFDLSGKNIMKKFQITDHDWQMVEFTVQDLAEGVYGYSLSENGKLVGTRKLVIIR